MFLFSVSYSGAFFHSKFGRKLRKRENPQFENCGFGDRSDHSAEDSEESSLSSAEDSEFSSGTEEVPFFVVSVNIDGL